jgi:riboflavin synthase
MFTGIIEEVGAVEALEPRLRIRCRMVLEDAKPGASIAVNGVCLTVAEFAAGWFAADVAPETLERSNLGDLRPGAPVNLERALSPSGRLGGHIVQGHVDAAGELLALDALGDGNWWLTVQAPEDLDPYLVVKGSVALDGISLTIAALEETALSVAVIPHTFATTALRARRPGDRINIECDILAKYVAKLLGAVKRPSSFPSVDDLREMGY